jgi:aspartate carbamoyltransferase catalytic subunit
MSKIKKNKTQDAHPRKVAESDENKVGLKSIEETKPDQTGFFLAFAKKLKQKFTEKNHVEDFFDRKKAARKVVLLAFIEPSTRTRLSFQMAAERIGVRTVTYTHDASTSAAKGEAEDEALLNLLAMKPDLVVLRHSGKVDLDTIMDQSGIPWISAGNGTSEHPTQGLLDVATVIEQFESKKARQKNDLGCLRGRKILYVGDVEHSRVARSGRILFQRAGCQVGICSPEWLAPKTSDWVGAKKFSKLDEAAKWADVVIGLRIQSERHHQLQNKTDVNKYVNEYCLNTKTLRNLGEDKIVMHPGPFVAGVDLNPELLKDKRCRIHQQVTNGVFVRMALLLLFLNLKKKK